MDKRIVVLSDMHCGHQYGLTPPEWQLNEDVEDGRTRSIAALERAAWAEYVAIAQRMRRPDILVLLSDTIDGKGELSGATELLTSDRRLQCHMAVACIMPWEARRVLLLHGTAYHTGASEDFDAFLCDLLQAKGCDACVHSRAWIEANGRRFHFRHHVSGSVIPHGRHTGPARGLLWLKLWEHDHDWPRTDIAWYGHVHYFTLSQQAVGMAITSPALQLYTKFGARRCDGSVDWGVVQATVTEEGDVHIAPRLVDFRAGEPEVIKI